MTLIADVKTRLGISYTEPNKDLEIQGMIDGAVNYFKSAGWIIDTSDPSPTATEAIILYCKMAQSTDPTLLTHHPVLTSMILQGRAVVPDEV